MTETRWLLTTIASIVAGCFLCLVFIVTALVWMDGKPDYPRLVPDLFGQIQDYAFTLHGADCQVLIYGDSTAVTGIDPVLVEQKTGLRTCNISQTQTIVSILGTLPLDAYLKQNRAPKYLVIQLSVETFYRDPSWSKPADVLYIQELLRHEPGLRTDWLLMEHYKETLNYFIYVSRNVFSKNHRRQAQTMRQDLKSTIDGYYAHHGWLSYPAPPETMCSLTFPLTAPLDVQWLESVRKKYSALGMTVLVDASPIPDCDPTLNQFRRNLAAYIDNPLDGYPITMFNSMDRHFTEEGAARASTSLSNQILALENKISQGPKDAPMQNVKDGKTGSAP